MRDRPKNNLISIGWRAQARVNVPTDSFSFNTRLATDCTKHVYCHTFRRKVLSRSSPSESSYKSAWNYYWQKTSLGIKIFELPGWNVRDLLLELGIALIWKINFKLLKLLESPFVFCILYRRWSTAS